MKKIFGIGLMGLCLVGVSSVAFAAPTCVSGADVTSVNGTGCSVGPLTFNNFVVTTAGGVAGPVVNFGGIYNPSPGPTPPNPPAGEYGVNFNPNLGGVGTTVTDIHFTFSITAAPGTIVSAYLFNGGTSQSQIQERICTVGVSQSGSCTGSDVADLLANGGFSNGPTNLTGGGQTTIWIWKDINIQNVSTDHLSSFDQAFGTTSTVPEPMTFSMMGAGLLGLGFLGRKLRKK